MSIFSKLSILASSGVLVFALTACPPQQEAPDAEVDVEVNEVETPDGTVMEETVEESGDAMEETAPDAAGDATEETAPDSADDTTN